MKRNYFYNVLILFLKYIKNSFLKNISVESIDYSHGEQVRPIKFNLKGMFNEVITNNLKGNF